MKKIFIVFIYCIFISLPSRLQTAGESAAQKKDSLAKVIFKDSLLTQTNKVDSAVVFIADSLANEALEILKKRRILEFQRALRQHPYLPLSKKPVESNLYNRNQTDTEGLFYFLVSLLLYFACIRLFFGKYIDNLTTLFFRVTMRQQQIREQLLQTPLPSLLLNILFVISCGLYLSLLARYYNFGFFGNFWITFLYAMGFVSGIYLGKYLVLKITGWVFNISNATDTYIFIVFLVNKMIGIFLLPIVILLSFPNQYLMPVLILLSYIMLILLLGYRFVNSFRPIRSEIKVNRFHFFLYLCAFEIAPLLLIYKVLLTFVERSN
ncbi:MAG: DUF4271 domain-containing protein [Chitinophagaceae bacterium]|nr:DUF4271 domain-containing protein [Chitinophagaceae bacterium]